MLIHRPERSLLEGLWSKRMFCLIVDISITISVSPTFLEDYVRERVCVCVIIIIIKLAFLNQNIIYFNYNN